MCPICGDTEAEPIAVCMNFRDQAASSAASLALRCSDCGTLYFSSAAAPIDLSRFKEPAAAELGRVGRQVLQRAHGIDAARILALQGESSIEPSSLRPESLQLIVLDGTLEYVREPLALLATLRQALRPEGHSRTDSQEPRISELCHLRRPALGRVRSPRSTRSLFGRRSPPACRTSWTRDSCSIRRLQRRLLGRVLPSRPR